MIFPNVEDWGQFKSKVKIQNSKFKIQNSKFPITNHHDLRVALNLLSEPEKEIGHNTNRAEEDNSTNETG